MSTKKCPNCGLHNAESALRCDCGYDFASAQVQTSYLQGGQLIQGKKFGARAGAYVIDLILLFVTNNGLVLISGVFLGIVLAMIGQELTLNQPTSQGLDFVLGLILSTLYFTLFEGLFGASVGKLILGMRVVQSDGRPCGLGAAFIRALLRFVDGLFFGLIAYGSMKPPLQQRLGDKAAKTVVVGHQDTLIQEHRPWWRLLIAALIYLVLATVGIIVVVLLAMQ